MNCLRSKNTNACQRQQKITKSNMQLCMSHSIISILLLNARDKYDEHDFFHIHALLLMFRVTCRTKVSRAQFRQRSTLSATKHGARKLEGDLHKPTQPFPSEQSPRERKTGIYTERTHHMRSASALFVTSTSNKIANTQAFPASLSDFRISKLLLYAQKRG